MAEDWVLIFTFAKVVDAYMSKDLLENNGINAHIIDKTDSSYTILSEIELYVKSGDVLRAIKILKEKNDK